MMQHPKQLLCAAAVFCAVSLCGLTAYAAEAEPPAPQTPPPPAVAATAAPPPAEKPLYPAEVRALADDNGRQIVKTYILAPGQDPADIPRGNFERDGWRYALTDITKNRVAGRDAKAHTETVTVDTDTNDLNAVIARLSPTLEYQSEDGFAGTLALNLASVKCEAAGYKSSGCTVSATREYPHLSNADTSLIPKTITENGRTLALEDVTWETQSTVNVDYEDIPESYRAVAQYTAKASKTVVTGYVTTADYIGEISRTTAGDTVYAAHFDGKELNLTLTPTETPLAEPGGGQSDTASPPLLWIIPIAAVLALLAGVGAVRKGRKTMKRLIVSILALAVCTSLAAPAFAYDYDFGSGPDSGATFGKATSTDDTVSPDPMSGNIRRNKDAAYLPPPYFYGSGDIPTDPSSLYHDNTPSGAVRGYHGSGVVGGYDGYGGARGSAETGVNATLPSLPGLPTSVSAAQETAPKYYADGSIGSLYVARTGKTIKVFEGEDLANLKKGAGHFAATSAWDGNVALCGHNRGNSAYFSFVKDMQAGDRVTYATPYGARAYEVVSKEQIDEYDDSKLAWSADNILTLITCVAGTPELRWAARLREVR
jgi:LPXTG-site transpeptidase (sortase) family protein